MRYWLLLLIYSLPARAEFECDELQFTSPPYVRNRKAFDPWSGWTEARTRFIKVIESDPAPRQIDQVVWEFRDGKRSSIGLREFYELLASTSKIEAAIWAQITEIRNAKVMVLDLGLTSSEKLTVRRFVSKIHQVMSQSIREAYSKYQKSEQRDDDRAILERRVNSALERAIWKIKSQAFSPFIMSPWKALGQIISGIQAMRKNNVELSEQGRRFLLLYYIQLSSNVAKPDSPFHERLTRRFNVTRISRISATVLGAFPFTLAQAKINSLAADYEAFFRINHSYDDSEVTSAFQQVKSELQKHHFLQSVLALNLFAMILTTGNTIYEEIETLFLEVQWTPLAYIAALVEVRNLQISQGNWSGKVEVDFQDLLSRLTEFRTNSPEIEQYRLLYLPAEQEFIRNFAESHPNQRAAFAKLYSQPIAIHYNEHRMRVDIQRVLDYQNETIRSRFQEHFTFGEQSSVLLQMSENDVLEKYKKLKGMRTAWAAEIQNAKERLSNGDLDSAEQLKIRKFIKIKEMGILALKRSAIMREMRSSTGVSEQQITELNKRAHVIGLKILTMQEEIKSLDGN